MGRLLFTEYVVVSVFSSGFFRVYLCISVFVCSTILNYHTTYMYNPIHCRGIGDWVGRKNKNRNLWQLMY